MHASLQSLNLPGHRQSAGNEPQRHPKRVRVGLERVVDLHRQFARRDDHEPKGTAALWRASVGQASDHGQAEGERLAGPRAGLAEDVAPGKSVGDGRRLNGERVHDVVA